jgi:hypothetical protein
LDLKLKQSLPSLIGENAGLKSIFLGSWLFEFIFPLGSIRADLTNPMRDQNSDFDQIRTLLFGPFFIQSLV